MRLERLSAFASRARREGKTGTTRPHLRLERGPTDCGRSYKLMGSPYKGPVKIVARVRVSRATPRAPWGKKVKAPTYNQSQPQKSNLPAFMPLWLFSLHSAQGAKRTLTNRCLPISIYECAT